MEIANLKVKNSMGELVGLEEIAELINVLTENAIAEVEELEKRIRELEGLNEELVELNENLQEENKELKEKVNELEV